MTKPSSPVLMMVLCAMVPLAPARPSRQPPPPDLAALLTRAGADGQVMAWCQGEFRRGRPGGYAVALANPHGRQFVVVDAQGTVMALAAFTGDADLACYTPAAAAALSVTIRRSTTIEGRVAPRWKTTVVCGFIENTTAKCWQYSPASRAFVRIGGWVT